MSSQITITFLISILVKSLLFQETNQQLKSSTTVVQTAGSRKSIPWNITQMILEGYDPRLRPNFGNPTKPVNVEVDLVVGSVDEISEVNMDFTLTIYLRQYWKDHRLSFGHILGDDISVMPVDGRITDKLWLPDTYFTNDKDSYLQDITVKNRMVRIKKDGTVVFGLRLSITASCVFELKKFPHDKQTCALFLESYGYNTKDIRLLWADDCVSGFEKVELPQFRVTSWQCTSLMANFSSGSYDRLNLEFVLSREVGFFVFQTYMPCIMVVCMSWVSFWINYESSPARVALGITTVLTMTTIFTSSRASLPRFSYVKAIDIYLLTCFVFVFASLIEYAVVNFNYWKLTHNKNKELKRQRKQELLAKNRPKDLTNDEMIALRLSAQDLPNSEPAQTQSNQNTPGNTLVNRKKVTPSCEPCNMPSALQTVMANSMQTSAQNFEMINPEQCRNGVENTFHPGFISMIQFADYSGTSIATQHPMVMSQNSAPPMQTQAFIVHNNKEIYYRKVKVPAAQSTPNTPTNSTLPRYPPPTNAINYAPPPPPPATTGNNFVFSTTTHPSGYTSVPQSNYPSVATSKESLQKSPSTEWQEFMHLIGRLLKMFPKLPNVNLPSGENVLIIDTYSRIFFPISFIIFNLLYWWHYIMEEKEN